MKKKKERHRIKMGPWSLKLPLKKHLEKKATTTATTEN